jgi:hypothetical protein
MKDLIIRKKANIYVNYGYPTPEQDTGVGNKIQIFSLLKL